VRRALRKVLPALSYHFSITWEHVADMPHGELEAYLDALHQLNSPRRRGR
jgi:hypothetical protein